MLELKRRAQKGSWVWEATSGTTTRSWNEDLAAPQLHVRREKERRDASKQQPPRACVALKLLKHHWSRPRRKGYQRQKIFLAHGRDGAIPVDVRGGRSFGVVCTFGILNVQLRRPQSTTCIREAPAVSNRNCRAWNVSQHHNQRTARTRRLQTVEFNSRGEVNASLAKLNCIPRLRLRHQSSLL
jgi:hypothetical protein